MKLSILDYGVIDQGKDARQALKETILLAQRAEELKFHRFWVAEHHNVHAFAISSPEIVMTQLLNQTNHIRIGSGGIMALHYSSYKIAETVKSLLAFHPNRLDLGLGSSLGTKQVTQALHSRHSAEDYGQVLATIKNYLIGNENLPVQPALTDLPQMWLLSTGGETARLAADLGLGYTFGIFPYIDNLPKEKGALAAQSYRQHFVASPIMPQARILLAVFVVIAESQLEAEMMAKSLDIWMLGNHAFNEFHQFPGREQALAYPLSDQQKQVIAKNRHRMVVGTPQEVKKQLDSLVASCQADELLLIPLLPRIEQRLEALALLADVYHM
ncbi:MsnO8 family LLM class oxidoreductase [Streptococcus cuniculipharyngis]|uniref:MsnO8 family LLM class oxidoreductase n=1 Tax=Streptococcus cuniculipharyngis TaxID=1562651 RepID=A0A5C5SER1_9STRE|nr:MsnO8 family LLM class oxidoreductase [Streptococcus cuniculipharyngis]TWS98822.1 MsnO8 family LLM class oxidoreductase [Streptococcus cuniculipharyngis]